MMRKSVMQFKMNEARAKRLARVRSWLQAALCAGVMVSLTGFGSPAWASDADGAEFFQQSLERESEGKLKDAITALEQLPPARRDVYVAVVRRAWLMYRLGQFESSVDAYRKAVALAPRSLEARVGMLLPQAALRRWTDSEATAREALAIEPNNYTANLRLAFAYYNLGRFAQAATLYRKLRDLYPSDHDVRSGLGWSLLKLGRSQEAAQEFKDLLAINPSHVLAKQGLTATGLGR